MTNEQIRELLAGDISAVAVSGKQGSHVIVLELAADTVTLTLNVSKITRQDHQINV